MTWTQLHPGDTIAGYTMIRVLGAGGMGTVYLVRHPRLPRNEALKVLASSLGADPAFRDRFTREADLAAQLDHPNIVSVLDAGTDDDLMWIAMQYVEGTDAAAIIRDAPALPSAAQAVDIVTQAAAGLDYAHARGMVHRDVKPANLLVSGERGHDAGQRVLIADFGVARLMSESTSLTGTGMLVGTLAYAAPELFVGDPITPAVDVYALGCTLYELLTGATVFERPDLPALMQAHLSAPVPHLTTARPDLPAEFDGVIARALAKVPADRFATCGALADAARRALDAAAPTVGAEQWQPTTVSRPPTGPSPVHMSRPHANRSWDGPVAPVVGRPPVPRPARTAGLTPGYGASLPTGPGAPSSRSRAPIILAAVVVLLVGALAVVGTLLLTSGGNDAPQTVATGPSGTTVLVPNAADPPAAGTGTADAGTGTPAAPQSLLGTWQGPVSGDQTGYDVVAQVTTESPMRASVRYPQLGCSGGWAEQSRSGQRLTLLESIDSGPCVTSEITLTPEPDGTLAFSSSYYAQSQGRTATIHATLHRT
ncbi:hypothetical protein GCM10009624_28270 [Gordonia sinesedis]